MCGTNRVQLVVTACNAVLRRILRLSLGSAGRVLQSINDVCHECGLRKTRMCHVSITDWGRRVGYLIFFRGMVWRQESYFINSFS